VKGRWWALAFGLLPQGLAAQDLPPVTVTGVFADTNSAKIRFLPVPGALDYRVYDVSDPADVKYAGQVHVYAPWGYHFALVKGSPAGAADGAEIVKLPLELRPGDFSGPGFDTNHPEVANIAPFLGTIPANEIEWNGLTHGVSATLVVEAVDAPGPAVPGNLTNYLNQHAVRGAGVVLPGASGARVHICRAADSGPGFSTSTRFFGADKGATPDGNLSTNGQLSYCSGQAVTAHVMGTKVPAGIVCGDTEPHAIARSAPFVVNANAALPVPSGPDADPAQLVADRFDSGVFSHRHVTDPVGGQESFSLVTPLAAWEVRFTNVDLNASSAFVAGNHYMDVIYDGGTATRTPVVHNNHGVITLSPVRTADFSGGRILHVTFEVDGQVDGRRWVGLNLAPANDPLVNWYNFNGPVNKTNRALFVQVFNNHISTDILSPDPADPTGTPLDTGLGSWPDGNRYDAYDKYTYTVGHGLDNRSRFDVFVSQTKIAIFEDGRRVSNDKLTIPIDYAAGVKIYFPHYLYHTANEINDLITYSSYQTFWINDVPYSDERHWNNMGFEVLPASVAWGSLGKRIVMPVAVPP
jgi:hypothetical protein